VVNASPVGLKATPLLIAARRRGLKIHHGRNMMSFAMPLAARFFGLPMSHDWNGAPLQS
jgi:shikimate dehydrogenase